MVMVTGRLCGSTAQIDFSLSQVSLEHFEPVLGFSVLVSAGIVCAQISYQSPPLKRCLQINLGETCERLESSDVDNKILSRAYLAPK